MKATARNLKVREQDLALNGTGVLLVDTKTLTYNIHATLKGEQDRELRLSMSVGEFDELAKAAATVRRMNARDFSELQRAPTLAPSQVDEDLEQAARYLEGNTNGVSVLLLRRLAAVVRAQKRGTP